MPAPVEVAEAARTAAGAVRIEAARIPLARTVRAIVAIDTKRVFDVAFLKIRFLEDGPTARSTT
jgi:hypothetical protein